MDYLIYIDASVDITEEFIKENDIRLIPMQYSLGETDYVCETIQSESFMHEFYEELRQGAISRTSQITPAYYEENFAEIIKEGKGILYISLSSGLSNTYSSSMVAIENLKDEYEDVQIETVDSLGATGGMGMLLMQAVRNRAAGMSLQENAAYLREHTLDICHWFMVEDLMYLKRGGRVSATTAIVGSALNVKPVLKITDEGKLETIAKQRGVAKTMKYLIQNYVEAKDDSNDVIIMHADSPDKAEELKQKVLEVNPDAEIQILTLGPIIGAHTGPGLLAIVHWGNRNYA